jgi:hypothetical protein
MFDLLHSSATVHASKQDHRGSVLSSERAKRPDAELRDDAAPPGDFGADAAR